MQIASRNALLRMAALMIAAGVALWYLCGRPAPGKRIMIPPPISTDQLRAHVTKLAGEFGEHNVANPVALRRAENYIAQVWREQGYTVVRQSYNVSGVDCANLEVTRRGAAKPDEIVLLGAHYDSVLGCPGANDNASGVAALLEISRVFAAVTPPRTLRFVAFVNEEPPHFQTAQQGSRVYARAAKQRGDDIRVMLALETLGWFSDEPGSQRFPLALFKLLYPTRGNFIGFVANIRSAPAMRRAAAAFRAHTDVPVECCATPAGIAGADLSDHAEFWRVGYRAVMVTDTALFRYPHYHTPEDTPDKVNYETLARVTQGLCGVAATLAGE